MKLTTKGQLKAFFFSGSVAVDTAGAIVDTVLNGRPTGGKALAQTLFSFGGYLFESLGSLFKITWKASEVKQYSNNNLELRGRINEIIRHNQLGSILARQELNIIVSEAIDKPWSYYTWIHNAALLFAAGCYFYEIPTTAKDEASIYPGPTASGALVFLASHIFASHKLESYLQALEQEERELIVYGFKVQTALLIKTIEEKVAQLSQIQQLPDNNQTMINQAITDLEETISALEELITGNLGASPVEYFMQQHTLAQHSYSIILKLTDQLGNQCQTIIELKDGIEELNQQASSFGLKMDRLLQENTALKAEVELLKQELAAHRHQ